MLGGVTRGKKAWREPHAYLRLKLLIFKLLNVTNVLAHEAWIAIFIAIFKIYYQWNQGNPMKNEHKVKLTLMVVLKYLMKPTWRRMVSGSATTWAVRDEPLQMDHTPPVTTHRGHAQQHEQWTHSKVELNRGTAGDGNVSMEIPKSYHLSNWNLKKKNPVRNGWDLSK